MRAFSAYLKKGNQNIDEFIGKHDLESSGCIIYNPQYAALYGRYIKRLQNLSYRPMSDEKRARLSKNYERLARSAKFWATFPHNADDFTPTEKKRIQQKLNYLYRKQN